MASAGPQIDERDLAELRAKASEARATNYARYSDYPVLAAVKAEGRFFGGSNIECVNYSLTKHAEEAAILEAISQGVGPYGGWLEVLYVAGGAPCGGCRQFAWEFASPETRVVLDDCDKKDIEKLSPGDPIPQPQTETYVAYLADLLPRAFGPRDLDDS